MPNDTAPEKTGSSENGDEAGRRNLLCDLADEQLRRNNRLAEIEFRRIVERSPVRRIPFQCLPLPGLPGPLHSLRLLRLVLVQKCDRPPQHRGLNLQVRIHFCVDRAKDRDLEARPDHCVAVAAHQHHRMSTEDLGQRSALGVGID